MKLISNNIVLQHRSTIYLLVIDEYVVLVNRLILYLVDDYNVIIIDNLDNIHKKDIVIPVCVKANTLLYNNICYAMLDDKKIFYNLLENYRSCLEHIHLIPSYDKSYKGANIFKNFLIKPANDWGSKNIIHEEGFVFDIISKYEKTHQIQDIIKIKNVYEVNFVCKDGEIVDNIMFVTNGSFTSNRYILGSFGTYTKKITKHILKLCKTIIASLNYNGLVEFEFIEDLNCKIYIMECNPRMTGHIDNPQYFKSFVEPYFDIKSTFANHLVTSGEYEYNKRVRYCDTLLFLQKYMKFKVGIK